MNYHNPQRMGYEPEDVNCLACVTSHPLGALPGPSCLVYLIGRRSGDDRYLLHGAFSVAGHRASPIAGFEWEVFGTSGRLLGRPFVLSSRPWFATLMREQANFSLGLNPVGSPVVANALHALVPLESFRDVVPPKAPRTPRALAIASTRVWERYKGNGAVFHHSIRTKHGAIQTWAFPKIGGSEQVLVIGTRDRLLTPAHRAAVRRFIAAGHGRKACVVSRALSSEPTVRWIPAET